MFDLDGTLTAVDTLPFLLAWTSIRRSWRVPLYLRTLPGLVGMRRGQRRAGDVKEELIGVAFGGMSETVATSVARSFVRWVLPLLVRRSMVRRLKRHRDDSDQVWIVSASPEIVVADLASRWGIVGGIGTRLEIDNGRCTGRFDGRNCVGDEKVRRLFERLGDEAVRIWMAYGDDPVRDGPLLSLAEQPVYVSERSFPWATGWLTP